MLALADVPAAFASDRIAIVHGEARWSWGNLDHRSLQWCAWLTERGVGADDLVAFALPNGPDFIALTFGVYRAGAIPAPISWKITPHECEAIIAVMKPRLVVHPGEGPSWEAPRGTPSGHVAKAWKACTSGGSTGIPKVIVDGRAAGFSEGTDFIGIPSDSCVLVPGPLYHNAPFSAAVFALWKGSTIITMDKFDAMGALGLIDDEGASWALMVPTMMHRIMALTPSARACFDLSRWAMVVHTAAPMAPWLKQAWIDWCGPDHIWEVYGATEGLVRCWIGGREWLDRPGSVGRPIGGGRLRILDEDGRECQAGEEGEVFAMPSGGPGSTYRYIGAERRATVDGWESVGDIGRLDADGYLYLADRRTDLIISGGVNIWPAEVEAAILRHPAVRSCAVVGRPDPDLGQSVHAAVEADAGALDLAALGRFLNPWLAREKHPRSLETQIHPVRDDAGKVRKGQLASAS
ncbi:MULTISPECIES: AMP-binding protein [unclassified Sphingopyxis]|uniref:AMP-binding protein n=1 Tax=unclassified Sphingopyxis TaxID=2614943 RepID=UPI00285E7D76|nr:MULTISPECIES: AMP-binding protein [unclassified Sphingopyxis]MDR6834105.1 bile acid-coenzyme A ligase [Sphingopyxis sp. BE122]MDR7226373.1 bile acid-coenzyme A ligase [Sphingopyxis sp. BE259]